MNHSNQPTLDMLKDIDIPNQVAFWPPAPGWWLLFGLIVFMLVFLISFLTKHHYLQKKRKYITQEVEKLWQNYQTSQNKALFASECSILMKRAAMTWYTNKEIAKKHGQEWVSFLNQSHNKQQIQHHFDQALINSSYQKNPAFDPGELKAQVLDWLIAHAK